MKPKKKLRNKKSLVMEGPEGADDTIAAINEGEDIGIHEVIDDEYSEESGDDKGKFKKGMTANAMRLSLITYIKRNGDATLKFSRILKILETNKDLKEKELIKLQRIVVQEKDENEEEEDPWAEIIAKGKERYKKLEMKMRKTMSVEELRIVDRNKPIIESFKIPEKFIIDHS